MDRYAFASPPWLAVLQELLAIYTQKGRRRL